MIFKYLSLLEIFSLMCYSLPLLQSSRKSGLPESKKFEVDFSRNGGPVEIKTENPLDEVKTDYPAYNVNSLQIKDTRKKNESLAHLGEADKKNLPVLYPPAEPIVIEKAYKVRKPQKTGKKNKSKAKQKNHPGSKNSHAKQSDLTYIAYVGDEHESEIPGDSLVSSMSSAENKIQGYHQKTNETHDEILQNLKLLEEDLVAALRQSQMETSIQMNPRTIKMIMAYLEHIDYIHNLKNGKPAGDKPVLPNWYTEAPPQEEMHESGADMLQLGDPKGKRDHLTKELAKVNEQLKRYYESGGHEEEIEELLERKDELEDKIEKLEVALDEEEEVKESSNLVKLEDEEEQLRTNKADDKEIAKVMREEDEVVFKKDSVKEHKAGAKVRRLRNRMLQVQSDLDTLAMHSGSKKDINQLEEEKKAILAQERDIINEVDEERLNDLEAELAYINNKEESLQNQPNTLNQINELEHSKAAIIGKEDTIRHQMEEPTEVAVEEVFKSFTTTPKVQSTVNSLSYDSSDEDKGLTHEDRDYQAKIDVDGRFHVYPSEDNGTIRSYQNGGNSLEVEDRDQYDSQEQTPMQSLLNEPLDLKFTFIDGYAKLDHLMQQFNVIGAIYTVSLSSIPDEKEITGHTKNGLHDNIKLLQKLRMANEAFSKYKPKIDDELYFLIEELNDLNLSLDGMLSFYDLHDQYDQSRTPNSTQNNEYLAQHMKLSAQAQVYKSQIDQLTKDANTLNSLHKLIFTQLDAVAMKNADTGVDEVKKVDMAIGTIKKINIVRKEIDSIVKEMKNQVRDISTERKNIAGLVEELNLLSRDVHINSRLGLFGEKSGSLIGRAISIALLTAIAL